MEKKKKIWLLYASFGGGHFAPAKALQQQLEAQYGDKAEVCLKDICEFGPRFVGGAFRRSYSWSVTHARWSYMLTYALNGFAPIAWLQQFFVYLISKRKFAAAVRRDQPDAVISFYFFSWGLERTLKKVLPQTIFCVAVTDPFTPHRLWFMTPQANYLVFSEQVRALALKKKIPESQISVFPFFIRKEFEEVAVGVENKKRLREKYSIAPNAPVLLITGGGAGIRAIHTLAESLLKLRERPTVVACGTNQEQYRHLKTMTKDFAGRLLVFGFVDFSHELLAIADVVLGKAGASSTMEALLLKKPLVLIDYIWGQEKGNKEYVVHEGLGWYEKNLKKVPELVQTILHSDEKANEVCMRLENLRVQSGAPEAARWLMEQLG